MASYIVPAAGQKFDPVVRRVVGYAKQVGENVRIDRSASRPRLVVGPKTLQMWRETNAARRAADRKSHFEAKEKRAVSAREAADQSRSAGQDRTTAKKAARKRKRKSTGTGEQSGQGQQ